MIRSQPVVILLIQPEEAPQLNFYGSFCDYKRGITMERLAKDVIKSKKDASNYINQSLIKYS